MTRARELAKVSTAYETGGAFGHRNKIINGAMVIDQRNAGASFTPAADAYTLDRWKAFMTQASKYSVKQGGVITPPVGFSNYMTVTSTSAYSVGASDYFMLSQSIEGYNIADLGWGTLNAKTVTLSFQVYSSLTGTFGGAVQNSANTRSYPFSYSIPVANTWTTISVTIAGDTTGTWLTDNSIGINLRFSLGMGSTFSGTAGAWAGSAYFSATGATSVVGTSGATFYITGVQLEAGSVATEFEHRSYGVEDLLCKRYLPVITSGGQSGAGLFLIAGIGFVGSTTQFYTQIHFPVTPRVAPTGVVVNNASYFAVNPFVGSAGAVSSISFLTSSSNIARVVANTSGLTNSGQGGDFAMTNGDAKIYFTGCEL